MKTAVFRPSVKVGDCATLAGAGLQLGGSKNLLHNHKERQTPGFPKPVARFGGAELYVFKELEVFYQSICWKQADRSISELRGA